MKEIKTLQELMDYCEKTNSYVTGAKDWKIFLNNWDILIDKR